MVNRLWFLALAILFVGCTTSPSDQTGADTSLILAGTLGTSSTLPEDAESTTASAAADTSSVAGAETESSEVDAFRPYDDGPTTTTDQVDTSVYITRVSMTADTIEMKWSTHNDAVTYHLHRLPWSDDLKPKPEAMTVDNKIHSADGAGSFVDNEVESGARYWYGLEALNADGVAVAHGWHSAAAVTDEEPPSLVENLSAVYDNGEVLVTWTRPDENFELHSYKVLRSVDGEELESMSTTWNINQTSFIDDGPPASGTVTYAVVAFDFHWNESDPASVDIALG